jgi:hypothetical protein
LDTSDVDLFEVNMNIQYVYIYICIYVCMHIRNIQFEGQILDTSDVDLFEVIYIKISINFHVSICMNICMFIGAFCIHEFRDDICIYIHMHVNIYSGCICI